MHNGLTCSNIKLQKANLPSPRVVFSRKDSSDKVTARLFTWSSEIRTGLSWLLKYRKYIQIKCKAHGPIPICYKVIFVTLRTKNVMPHILGRNKVT